MTVVNGFPFKIPDVNALTIFMPYYNFLKKQVQYQGFEDVYLSIESGGDGFQGVIAKWAWLNKLNPDWQHTKNLLPQGYGPFTLSGGGSMDGIAELDVDIVVGLTVPNRWYGTADVAKFGLIAFTSNGRPVMPFQYINLAHCTFLNDNPEADGFVYALVPGVAAHFTAYTFENSNTNPTLTPALFYVDPNNRKFNGWGDIVTEIDIGFSLDGAP